MTGVVLIKTAVALGVIGADGCLAIAAVIDPSVTNLIGLGIGALVTIAMGVIGLKTVSLNTKVKMQELKSADQDKQIKAQDVKVEGVAKSMNGMKDALVASTAEASKAKGILEEKGAETVRQAERILAASVASTVQQVTKEPVILKNIEKHTEDTANNTARTEADVQEIKDETLIKPKDKSV